MTLISDDQQLETYVPVYDVIPETWEQSRPFIVEQFKRMANAINKREVGFFLDTETLAGKFFIPGVNDATDGGSSQQFRNVLRKVINFGPLPNNTTSSVPHGITFDANFTLISLWGAATDPVALVAIPIPFVSTPGEIQVNMTATKINVSTTSNRTSFTRTFFVIEYLQEL